MIEKFAQSKGVIEMRLGMTIQPRAQAFCKDSPILTEDLVSEVICVADKICMPSFGIVHSNLDFFSTISKNIAKSLISKGYFIVNSAGNDGIRENNEFDKSHFSVNVGGTNPFGTRVPDFACSNSLPYRLYEH